MDPDVARWLVSDAARPVLAAAAAEADPASLAAGTRLRALTAPDLAAAALAQVALRRRARAKFGDRAERLFLTPDGLEQATRAEVAVRRARRFAALGARRVVDLGCGIGADALAVLDGGLDVVAVERDEATAVFAAANLGREVVTGDAEERWPELSASDTAVFADPARRTASGRSWRVEDLSPPWPFVASLLDGTRPACVKLGPGVPHAVLPPGADAEWVSDAGTVVECAVWAGPGLAGGARTAVVDGVELPGSGRPPADVGPVAAFVYEPDGAVVRAGLVDELAGLLRAHRVASGIAYLTADAALPTPFATCFRVLDVLPFDEKVLRAWVRERGIGTLEIKKRGLDVDPAALRKRLKPTGRASATLILTPTERGAVALVAERTAS
ncbi:class I SAM-dependent methyltransferase [Propioniciclava soli]|uniref:Class I SAM-dependent methyltransferase n=1 Tax=Propioniciclava soli TaxID=2775081 RepID=A0ABZ3CA25_9ACTN